ncbi:protein PHLOEM PROTEIN 2-LIKE A10 [Rhodamnia argentea]|uniref:Protein PHLOEM PROTEIN 2-LIKE A10 n=1 Tax=Rhodamnia argentea TaxID=178133 RepID=A0ABM3GZM1_9MYRT|nr:protein PHLOEM PROTEIN 2-LIKE A10 [Rhodamnia argentea]
MDLELVKRCLNFSHRRRKLLILLAVCGVSSYGAYRVYQMPSVARKRKRVMKLLGAVTSMAEMVSESAETVGVVSRDLKEFLQSDSDQMPKSLRQIAKIAKSDEFCEGVSKVTEALTVGMLRAYKGYSGNGEISQGNPDITDRVMDRFFSTAGSGFASVVVGSFARNLVMGFYAASSTDCSENGDDSLTESRWVNAICNDKCKELMANCIQKFVSTAVEVFLDKTKHINTYDELFSGLTNPSHQDKVRDVLVTVCNGAVETFVKTSHQVLTSTNSSSPSGGSVGQQREWPNMAADKVFDKEVISKLQSERISSNGIQRSEWLSKASSTLAVPSNRKFVLDVTGRVTLETIRSALAYLLWRLLDGIRHGVDIVSEKFVDRGLQVIRFFGAKSHVIVTVCLALYLHVHGGSRILVPA